jgi:RsiW-degrading membrane proteinase PrsW (M82 family)
VLVALVAFGPSLLLMLFFYAADRYEPEPRGHVLAAIGLGALAVPIALGATRAIEAAAGELFLSGSLGARVFEAFALEGLPEEGARWLLLVGVVYRWQEFDEPLDGVIYGVAVALGFGTVENALYVAHGGLKVGLLRAIFAVPEHALLGATMGAFLGVAKHLTPAPQRRAWLLAMALVVPMLLHGTYDLLLLVLVGPPMYLAVGAGSVALWVFVLRRVARARERSPFKPQDPGHR